MTLNEVFASGLAALQAAGIADADFDCACLFEDVFHLKKTALLLAADRQADAAAVSAFDEKIRARAAGRPLQYILGTWDFYDMSFLVGEGVLNPRPETETLVETALELMRGRQGLQVFDLCTGSGCIGLTLAAKRPDCRFYLIDISADALRYAEKNRARYGLENVTILRGDIRRGFTHWQNCAAPDMILSNPPYIAAAELPFLQSEVQREPSLALDGGADGLDFYRVIAEHWLPHLKKDGFAMVECGEAQATRIAAMFAAVRGNARISRDVFGVERFVSCH